LPARKTGAGALCAAVSGPGAGPLDKLSARRNFSDSLNPCLRRRSVTLHESKWWGVPDRCVAFLRFRAVPSAQLRPHVWSLFGVAACSSDSSRFEQPMFHGTARRDRSTPSEKVGVGYGGVPQRLDGFASAMQQGRCMPAAVYAAAVLSAAADLPAAEYPQAVLSWLRRCSRFSNLLRSCSPIRQRRQARPSVRSASTPHAIGNAGNDVAIIVGEGETLYSISRRYGIPVTALHAAPTAFRMRAP
jgi:hypothetical protein